jgi:competence protein ComEA
LADGAQVVISEKGGHSGSSQDGVASISQTGVDAGSSQSGSDRVDINTAGPEELTNIPGIGQSKASAIVSYRQEHGRFEKPEDLMKITGIKQGIFNKIKDYIKV